MTLQKTEQPNEKLNELKNKYNLSAEDIRFIIYYCRTFNVKQTAYMMKISTKTAEKMKILLQEPIFEYALPMLSKLREQFIYELYKSLKQDNDNYLKAVALNIIAKMENYVSTNTTINININQRETLIKEAQEILKEIGATTNPSLPSEIRETE